MRQKEEKTSCDLASLAVGYVSTDVFSSAWEALTSRPVSSLVFIKSYLTFTKETASESKPVHGIYLRRRSAVRQSRNKTFLTPKVVVNFESSVSSSTEGKTEKVSSSGVTARCHPHVISEARLTLSVSQLKCRTTHSV